MGMQAVAQHASAPQTSFNRPDLHAEMLVMTEKIAVPEIATRLVRHYTRARRYEDVKHLHRKTGEAFEHFAGLATPMLAATVLQTAVNAYRNAGMDDDNRRARRLMEDKMLFALARALAEASPGDASRATLLSRAFGAKHVDETHRARLRVEIGRLRKVLSAIASIEATSDGFALRPRGARDLVVLAPLTEKANAHVLALLGDGESWSSSALALALGASQRTVQRALDELLAADKVRAVGKARARRWMAPPVPGFPTSLLLPAALPSG